MFMMGLYYAWKKGLGRGMVPWCSGLGFVLKIERFKPQPAPPLELPSSGRLTAISNACPTHSISLCWK